MLPLRIARTRIAVIARTALLASAWIGSAAADDPTRFTWTAAADGVWSDATKWTDDLASGTAPVAAGLADYVLEFGVEGTYTATQDQNAGFKLNVLRFSGSEVTLDGNGLLFVTKGAALPSVEQNGAAAVAVDMPVSLQSDLTFGGTGSGTAIFSGAITGNGGLTKGGGGILSLTGPNSYRGATTVNGGTLRLAQANTGNDKSVLTLAAGATLDLAFTGSDTVAALVIDGVPKPDGLYDASNSGGAITGTGGILVVTPIPSSNASLASLSIGGTSLSPAFSPLFGNYSTSVPNSISSVAVTPTVAGEGATVTVNGSTVDSGTASNPVALAVGPNLVTTVVRAQDNVTTRTYTVNVNRASAATVSTSPAVVIDSSRATLNGSANPNGASTVYFEYGPTTAFGSRTADRDISGNTSRAFAASLSGLSGATTYHFRAVLFNAAGTIYGTTRQFTTAPNPPIAATGAPANVTASTATLVGAVNPNGVKASVYFEYGLTKAYGQSTPIQNIPAGFSTVAVQAPNLPLIPDAAYYYRLVASNSAGTALGNDVLFTVTAGGGVGSGVPTAAPTVVTEAAVGVGGESAILQGSVNPNGGTTLVSFEYGLTPAYGLTTVPQGVGNGDTAAAVARPVQGLLPGTTYHYRVTASNSLGVTQGDDAVFTTSFPAPTAVTGESTVLTTTRVRIEGEARARGASAEVWIDYGTDGITFNSVRAEPADVSGDQNTAVSAEIGELAQGVTYYYRVRALGPNGVGTGETKTFDVSSLSGLIQQFPPGVPLNDRRGSVDVTLSPPDIGSGWRFQGEQFWRESGVPSTGLTTGDRVIEFRPVPGYVQPAAEAVAVLSSAVPTTLARTYVPTAEPANGNLTVFLKPQDLTEGIAPARWRFFGEGDDDWKESGTTVSGLVAGDYVILSKPVDGRTTPPPVTASVVSGEVSTITITYYIADVPVGDPPVMVGFEAVSGDTSLPNAFVGQIRSDAGSGTGFVVRPRVVATVGHVIFDDGTLAITTGLQWLFQRDRDVHDPVPQVPRGHYLMSGYAAQRILDNSPGVSSPQSQNLDAATMFFLQDVGRGGYSGYLASDTASNEFLLSAALKTLVGYPIDGIPEGDLDRMHATAPANIAFTKSFERTYTTSGIRASGGASGSPLCVLGENGAYYPAAIYLGGTGQTVVRALDSEVVEMIGLADASSSDGVGVIGGSQTSSVNEPYESEDAGALKVVIEPATARAAGAGWRISSANPYLPPGEQLNDLAPDTYLISFPALAGFVPPTPQSVTIEAGVLTTITFDYEQVVTAPVINSPATLTANRGEAITYQITAEHSPVLFTLSGLRPAGTTFDTMTGLLGGSLLEAGVFPLGIGASNSGGADSKQLVLTSLPVLEAQAFSAPYLVPMSYGIVSSEGAGSTWTATGLPGGLGLNPSTGVISGIPQNPGIYQIPISVTTRGARTDSTLTLTITGVPPQITLQPVAARSIQYGTGTTLTVAATGLPEPEFQWYEGPAGNTDAPVPGATSAVFNTPPLTTTTTFWARVSSFSGTADSNASVISILPSSNANLLGIFTSDGEISPAFNLNLTSYTLAVPNDVTAIQITPLVEVAQSTVKVKGILVPNDAASDPVELNVGSNTINIDVTSGTGTVTKRYTLTVTRGQPPSVATLAAINLADATATLRGTATPNGKGTVFFQYGTTPAYGNATAGEEISSTAPLAVSAAVSGLLPEVTYHYRAGLTTGAGTIFGSNMTFTTTAAPPLVATGQPSDVVDQEGAVRFIGAVDTNGTTTSVRFEYGEAVPDSESDPVYEFSTPVQVVPGGPGVVDVEAVVTDLVPGTFYYYRLIGTSALGDAFGDDVLFIAGQTSGGSGIPVAVPDAVTLDALDVTSSSALFQGTANPQGGTTFVRFEYGLTPAYGSSTPARGIGSGTEPATVIDLASGLLPGVTYHYRLVASNSLGTSYGEDRTFVTGFAAPLATTGNATPLTASSVRLAGSVRARGAAADAFFEYGTDGVNFPIRIAVPGGPVSGDAEVPVQVTLPDLVPGLTYHYRALASRTGDPGSFSTGLARTFQSDGLVGLIQSFPREIDASERQGQLQVNLIPDLGAKWRFVGEVRWRDSGSIATGLTTGDREIEFLPVSGYLQPGRELVGIISGAPMLVLEREYFVTTTPANSSLQVLLEPQDRAAPTVPTSSRVQWRLLGYDSTPWRNSGEQVTGLMAGNYLVEFKSATGLDAPPPSTVVIASNQSRLATFAYNPSMNANAITIRDLPFSTISSRRNLPYAYVGQIRNDTGSHSGFAVKTRVVATSAQAVFDEITLSQIPGIQWLHQNDKDIHEPKPLVPRGFYVFDGYAAQRGAENTPGVLSTAAQDLNVASMYFLEDAGRGGFSGFLPTSPTEQPLLSSTTLKTVVGYPVGGGGSINSWGQMKATRIDNDPYIPLSAATYTTTNPNYRALSGMKGGPLCIQLNGGNYYPAGIFLGGGTSQNLVRAIDAGVIDLFNRAELTANTGSNNNSGGISQTSYTAVASTSNRGSLTVILEPAEARAAGALWKLGSDSSFLASGTRKNNLTPGDYILQVRQVAGFQMIPQMTTTVNGNSLTTVTVTYLPELNALASWRTENFGSTANAGAGADGGDADGDGSLNLDEYIAGTDPNDPNDVFRTKSATLEGSSFSIVVPAKAGRTYTLQRRADLSSGTWSDVLAIGPVDADGDLTLSDPAATGDAGFYQVVVASDPP